MAFLNRFSTTTSGALVITGNTLGLGKQTGTNQPGTDDSIGAFITTNTALATPIGWGGIVNLANNENVTYNWQENSSSAYLNLPATATVLYAELIWGGLAISGLVNVLLSINDPVDLTTPGGSFPITPDPLTYYSTLTADVWYVRSQDVTAQVAAGGSGLYTVGKVPSALDFTNDVSNMAGWTLIVAYEDNTMPVRNLSVYAGGAYIESGGLPVDIDISGFKAPDAGTVTARVLVSAEEGDAIFTGDQLLFGPIGGTLVKMHGPNNPATPPDGLDNFFASQINIGDPTNINVGNVDTTGSFGNYNQNPFAATNVVAGRQGWDITNVDVGEGIQNSQTSARIELVTVGDRYLANGLGVQIDTDASDLAIVKTASPEPAAIGGQITYTLTVTNNGPSDAPNTTITDVIPLTVLLPEYSLDNGLTWNLWLGSVNIGTLAVGATAQVLIRGTVALAALGTISNTATVDSDNPDLDPTNNTSTFVSTLAELADVYVTKISSPIPATAGSQITYTIIVGNLGPSTATGVSLADTVPPELLTPQYSTNGGGSWSNWTGSLSIGTLAPLATSTVLLRGTVDPAATLSMSNTATVTSTTTDPNPLNNTAIDVALIDTLADIYVTKTASPDPATASNPVTYTITVGNNGPSVATDILVTDLLVADLLLAEYSLDGGATWSAWLGTYLISALGVGLTTQILLRGTISPTFIAGILDNTVNVLSPVPDPNLLNNTDIISTDVLLSSDVYIQKTASPDPVTVGQVLTYTLVVGNNGPTNAIGVVVTDVLAVTLLNQQYSLDGGTSWASWLGAYTIGTMAVGEVQTILIRGTVNPLAVGAIINTATVASLSPDPDLLNNTAITTSNLTLLADIYVQKVASPNPVIAGNMLTYTLTVGNNGPSTASSISLDDAVPAQLSAVEYSLDGGGSWSSWSGSVNVGNLASGATLDVLIRGTVDPAATGSIDNTGTVSSLTLDPNPLNNTVTQTTQLDASADIYVTKTALPSPVIAGTPLTYTITVGNNGPSVATAVTLTDAVAAGLLTPQYSLDGGINWNTWTGSYSVGTLDVGEILPVQIRGTVSSGQSGSISNTASVSSPTPDPVMGNNTTTISTTVNLSSDVYIQKTSFPYPVTAGTQLTYTLTVGNYGPSDATGVNVLDTVPGELLNPEYSVDGGLTWNTWSGSYPLGALVQGTIVTIQIRGTIAADTVGTVSNTANVTSTSPDPDLTNNTATEITNTNALSDIYVQKTAAPNPVIAGEQLTYTIIIGNNGPSTGQGVQLTDAIVAALTSPQYSTDGGLTWNAWSGNVAIGTLNVGTTVTVLIRGIVRSNMNSAISNTATVSSTTPDPDPSNNASSVSTNVNQSADIYISKTASPDPVIAGEILTYTLVFGNLGPSDASNVSITDSVPVTLITPEYSTDGGSTWALWAGTYNVSTLAAGTNSAILVRGTVGTGVLGTVSNTAMINSTTPDPDPSNNTSSVTTSIETLADIYVNKTDSPDPVVAGEVLTYTLVVGNLGPSDALTTVLTDSVPLNLLVPEYSTDNGMTWLNWLGSYAVGTVVAGTTQTILIRGTIDPAALGAISNTASVNSNTPDPNLANNTSTTAASISALGDLAIIKSAMPDPVVAGTLLTYSLVVTNIGPSTSQGVIISDAIPAEVTGAEYSTDNGASWSAWTGSYNAGTLQPAASMTILIRGTVGNSVVGTVSNVANVTAVTPDPNPANNTSQFVSQITQLSDVSVVKTGVPDPVIAGEMIQYSIVVSNAGPSDAQGVVIDDAVTSAIYGTEYSTDGGTSWVPWTGSYTIGNLSVGGNSTILIRGTVRTDTLQDIGNTVTVSSTTPDPNPDNNTSTITTVVETLADIAIVKTGQPNPVTAGKAINYTLVITNYGPSDAQNVRMADSLSSVIEDAVYSLDGGVTWNTWTGVYILGTLVASGIAQVLISGQVSSDATTTLTNTATVDSNTPDPDLTNNTSTVNTLVNNVELLKTSNVAGAVVGDTVSYTLTIQNKGEVTAENMLITDPLTTGLSYANNLRLNGAPISGNITAGVNIGNVLASETVLVTFDATVTAVPSSSDKSLVNEASAGYSYRALPTDPPITEEVTSNANVVRVYEPQIEVTKSASTVPVVVNQPFSYTLVIKNTGDIAQSQVTVIDSLPSGFVVQSMTLNGAPITGNLNMGVNIGDLAIGEEKELIITVIVGDTVDVGAYNNLATLTGEAQIDPNRLPVITTSEGIDEQGVKIYDPKLILQKSADKAYAVQNEIVTYRIEATNQANAALNNIGLDQVMISDMLDSNLEFVTGSVTVNGVPMLDANIFSGISIGSLAVNETKVITFKAKVLSEGTNTITNTAQGEFEYLIPGLPMGRGTAQSNENEVTVEKVIVEVIKVANQQEVLLGDTLTYTITITNKGDLTAYNVRFTDTLPPQVTLVPGSFKIGNQVVNGVDLSKGIIIPAVLPGQTITLSYQVKVIGSSCNSVIINQASITFDYRLPDGTGGTMTVSNALGSTTTDLAPTTFKQMEIEANLAIPEVKPDIEAINNVTGTIENIDCHLIETTKGTSTEGQSLTGYKLIVKGVANISIEYTALEATQSVHSAHYLVPFTTFVILSGSFQIGSKLDVSGLIEDIYFKAMDTRNFFVNVTTMIQIKNLSCELLK